MDVDQLIAKSIKGDQKAFGELVFMHQDFVFSVVFRLVNIEADAEDIVQNVFVKVWQKIKIYRSEKSKFTTWLYAIATRMALDYIRKVKPMEDLDESIQCKYDMEKEMDNRELGILIRNACSQLSARQKLIFVLRDLEELPVDEVVEITGFSEKVIKDNLYVARKKIREKIGGLIIFG